MGFAEDGGKLPSEDDDEGEADEDGSPIEMTLVNRRAKDGLRKKR